MYSNSVIHDKEKSITYAKAHMNFLKSKVKFKTLVKNQQNQSNKVLNPNYSNDELLENSIYLTQQQKIIDSKV